MRRALARVPRELPQRNRPGGLNPSNAALPAVRLSGTDCRDRDAASASAA